MVQYFKTMKKLFLILLFFTCSLTYGQIVKMNVQGQKEITTAQRDGLTVPSGEFWQIYNITTAQWEYWDGDSWEALSGGADNLQTVTDTGNTTTNNIEVNGTFSSYVKVTDVAGVKSASLFPDSIYFTEASGAMVLDNAALTGFRTQVLQDASGTIALLSDITGGAIDIDDEGILTVSSATKLNFTGSAVTVTDAGAGEATINIVGGTGESTTVSDTAEVDLTLTGSDITADLVTGSIDETKLDASTNASLDLADTGLQNIVEDTTPQLGGELDAVGNNIIDLGDVTFQTGATGGTVRTGTSNADKFILEGYDVNGATYVKVLEVDAGNDVRLQISVDFLELEDATDETKLVGVDLTGATTSTKTDLIFSQTANRNITYPDASGTLALEGNIFEKELVDLENNINVGFTLTAVTRVFYNGQLLENGRWSGEGTAVLNVSLDTKEHDSITVKN